MSVFRRDDGTTVTLERCSRCGHEPKIGTVIHWNLETMSLWCCVCWFDEMADSLS